MAIPITIVDVNDPSLVVTSVTGVVMSLLVPLAGHVHGVVSSDRRRGVLRRRDHHDPSHLTAAPTRRSVRDLFRKPELIAH